MESGIFRSIRQVQEVDTPPVHLRRFTSFSFFKAFPSSFASVILIASISFTTVR